MAALVIFFFFLQKKDFDGFWRKTAATRGVVNAQSQLLECGCISQLRLPCEMPDCIAMAKAALLCAETQLIASHRAGNGEVNPQNTLLCWRCPHGARVRVCL